MEIIFIYLIIGILISYLNIDQSEKYITNATYDKYKDKKYSNSIKKIIYFYNVRITVYKTVIALSYIFIFPLMIAIRLYDKKNYNKNINLIPHIFLINLFFKVIGEIPAHKGRNKKYKNKTYQIIYTFSGKFKSYQNNKLHSDIPFFRKYHKNESEIPSAIKSLKFYYKNGKTNKFPLNHKERFFFEGKEINRKTYNEFFKLINFDKINNF